jgi:hypothetical protein
VGLIVGVVMDSGRVEFSVRCILLILLALLLYELVVGGGRDMSVLLDFIGRHSSLSP